MRTLLILFLFVSLVSCKDEEAYPFDQSPYVEFEEFVFYDNQLSEDTLTLSFIVWDREGDLGIDLRNRNYPFHVFNVITDSNDELVRIKNEVVPPFYSVPMNLNADENNNVFLYDLDYENKEFFSNNDSRSKFSCDKYLPIPDLGFMPYDTLLGSKNKNRSNLQINFLTEQGVNFNFQEILNIDDCFFTDFYTIIPRFDEASFFNKVKDGPFEIEKRDKYSYRVTYNIRSAFLKGAFIDSRFELKFQVLDRELNKSNFGSSGLVTLQEITN